MDLEENVADAEGLLQRKEEEYRQWDNKRQRDLFDQKLTEWESK